MPQHANIDSSIRLLHENSTVAPNRRDTHVSLVKALRLTGIVPTTPEFLKFKSLRNVAQQKPCWVTWKVVAQEQTQQRADAHTKVVSAATCKGIVPR